MPRRPIDLFTPVVASGARHKQFEDLRSSEVHAGARRLMVDAAEQMTDVDGNFAREFQTNFHARVFELGCFLYLREQGLQVDRSHTSPDFFATRGEKPVAAIEAVTSNSPSGQQEDLSVFALKEESTERVIEKANEEFPIRVGSALYTKLKKAYWALPHCKDVPFVLALGPFHEAGSVTYVDQSLARFLYGVDQFSDWVEIGGVLTRQRPVHQHEFEGKVIPSHFFGYPTAENISAVVYCNQLTVPRFFRIAAQEDGWPAGFHGVRMGYYLDPDDGPTHYQYMLGDEAAEENWCQGVTVLHNPAAVRPLPRGALACSCEYWYRDGYVECELNGFHPMTSFMLVGKDPTERT